MGQRAKRGCGRGRVSHVAAASPQLGAHALAGCTWMAAGEPLRPVLVRRRGSAEPTDGDKPLLQGTSADPLASPVSHTTARCRALLARHWLLSQRNGGVGLGGRRHPNPSPRARAEPSAPCCLPRGPRARPGLGCLCHPRCRPLGTCGPGRQRGEGRGRLLNAPDVPGTCCPCDATRCPRDELSPGHARGSEPGASRRRRSAMRRGFALTPPLPRASLCPPLRPSARGPPTTQGPRDRTLAPRRVPAGLCRMLRASLHLFPRPAAFAAPIPVLRGLLLPRLSRPHSLFCLVLRPSLFLSI